MFRSLVTSAYLNCLQAKQRSHFCFTMYTSIWCERLNLDALLKSNNMERWKIHCVSRQSNLNYNFACRGFNLSLYIFKSRKILMLRISYNARLDLTKHTLFFIVFLPWLIKSHESSGDLNVAVCKAKLVAVLFWPFMPLWLSRLICKPFTRVSDQPRNVFAFAIDWH